MPVPAGKCLDGLNSGIPKSVCIPPNQSAKANTGYSKPLLRSSQKPFN